MGILGILRDSAGILGDSRGFSGFLEKVYEVSEVSSPSIQVVSKEPWIDYNKISVFLDITESQEKSYYEHKNPTERSIPSLEFQEMEDLRLEEATVYLPMAKVNGRQEIAKPWKSLIMVHNPTSFTAEQ